VDSYTPRVLSLGLKATVGKGARGEAVVEAMRKYKAVYFHAVGGAAALISKSIKKSDIVGFEDLGTECIRKLEVESFPCVVAQDCFGESMYRLGLERYRVSL
jgi:fumarate hydratase subunit beta